MHSLLSLSSKDPKQFNKYLSFYILEIAFGIFLGLVPLDSSGLELFGVSLWRMTSLWFDSTDAANFSKFSTDSDTPMITLNFPKFSVRIMCYFIVVLRSISKICLSSSHLWFSPIAISTLIFWLLGVEKMSFFPNAGWSCSSELRGVIATT